MQRDAIPYPRVPKSSALLIDYVYHYERVAAFYGGNPRDFDSLKALAERLGASDGRRSALAEILLRQNRALGCGPETIRNVERLADAGTLAVVTGQQTGFFSGPVFTLYKALTAIKLTEFLRRRKLAAVPVFWLASEDHDLEEVAQANFLDDADELVPLGDSGERPAPQSSVGYARLSAGVASAIERAGWALPQGESRERLLTDLRDCYQSGATWPNAFGRFMTRLFGRWGVVLLDPLDEGIHRLSAHIYREAISRADEFRLLLRQRSQELIKAGYHAQVHVADDSTLVFMEREGSRLPLHHRHGHRDSGYYLSEGEDLSVAELDEKIQADPLRFSPNVLLRPAVQDCLLPTLAYVAGPSELAYFGQAQALYQAFGRPMPVIFPRAAFTLLDSRCRRLLEKYHLSVEDVWQGEGHLSQRIGAAGLADGWTERFEQNERDLNRIMERLGADIEALDPTLLDALRRTEEKIRYQVEKLKGKMTRAALERSELLRHHKEMLLRFLTPNRNLQERVVSGAYFLGRAGYEWLDRLLEHIDLESFDHQLFDI